jgi:hypothetical protein
MSEAFYDKVLSLFFGFSLFLILFIANAELLFLYLSQQQNYLFYLTWLAFLGGAALYGIKFYRDLPSFRANLGLFVPNPQARNEIQVESVNFETEDNALKVCLSYQQGAKLEQIQHDLGLTHPQQVKRELIKGLTFLLKFYHDHRDKKVET